MFLLCMSKIFSINQEIESLEGIIKEEEEDGEEEEEEEEK